MACETFSGQLCGSRTWGRFSFGRLPRRPNCLEKRAPEVKSGATSGLMATASSAAWRYRRESFLSLYGSLPTCTPCCGAWSAWSSDAPCEFLTPRLSGEPPTGDWGLAQSLAVGARRAGSHQVEAVKA